MYNVRKIRQWMNRNKSNYSENGRIIYANDMAKDCADALGEEYYDDSDIPQIYVHGRQQ